MSQTVSKPHEAHPLDALTGGAFSAPTAGERAARVREWLASQPTPEQMQDVFKELSARDKGAARPVREKLDELRRAKNQEAVGAEWASKAEALLTAPRLNIADAIAWQRDAAKAGAPLSREPLSALKSQLAERIRAAEDLQTRVQVQREAAVLLAQRTELLSTKPWHDAQTANEVLRADVAHWQAQADALVADAGWASLDPKFPPLLEASRGQLAAVWDAFSGALAQTVAAAADPAAPLPPVPVWADELRAARGQPAEAAPKTARPKVDPEVRARAAGIVQEALTRLEREVAEGHGKATAGAAAALRNALKEHGRLAGDKLEGQAHAALAAAGELEGWQRWRADQLREELVARAEALMAPAPAAGSRGGARRAAKPAAPALDAAEAAVPASAQVAAETHAEPPVPEVGAASAVGEVPSVQAVSAPDAQAGAEAGAEAEGQAASEQVEPASEAAPVAAATDAAPADAADATAAAAAPATPRLGGRKMQETLRNLREQWKQTDQGGPPNHALWKRFDEACNAAHKVVEAWLERVRAESAEHKSQRLALIAEVRDWTAAHAADTDWKAVNRALHQYAERWRASGHLGEKAFAELQPQWKDAISAAHATLEAAQKASVERRQGLIAEATQLGAAPMLRIDAVKALQQRWQAEAQSVPLDRKFEQRLWDSFRKPIDEAFNRKSADREKADAAMSERDRAVLDASKALEAASAGGDAQKIRQAMAALDAALRAQAHGATVAPASAPASTAKTAAAGATSAVADATATSPATPEDGAAVPPAGEAGTETAAAAGEGAEAAPAEAAAPAAPRTPPKPVKAVRGDDRPGMRRDAPAAPTRGGRPGERRDAGRPGGDRGPRGGDDRRMGRGDAREPFEARGPRLGDAAFRAQREALERAEFALRKLSAQAHGEALTQVLQAWEQRTPEALPSAAELGRAVPAATRQAWSQALASAPAGDGAQALLRLEMAAEVPTPAEQLSARRAMQLQLLTRRNDPAPVETWGRDAATVLAAGYDAGSARRLQNALKALLRR